MKAFATFAGVLLCAAPACLAQAQEKPVPVPADAFNALSDVSGGGPGIYDEEIPERKWEAQGHEAYVKHDYKLAVECWSNVIAASPKDAQAFYNRGRAYAAMNEQEKAIADFTGAIRLAPKNPDALDARGDVYAIQARDAGEGTDLRRELLKKALADYAAAARFQSNDEGETYGGWEDDEKDRAPTAVARWRVITQLDPKNAEAWFNKAEAGKDILKESENLDDKTEEQIGDQALKDYSEAIRLNANEVRYYLARANLYFSVRGEGWGNSDFYRALERQDVEGNREPALKAIADYTEAIRLKSTAETYKLRADLYDALGEHDKAVADYTEALKLNPKDQEALTFRAEDNRFLGNNEKALEDLNIAIKKSQYNLENLRARAQIYYRMKRWDDVIADTTRTAAMEAREDGERIWDSLNLQGDAWYHKGMYAKALADFKRAEKDEPDGWWGVNGMAWLMATCPDAKFRNGPKAVKLIMEACMQSEWDEADYIDTLAAGYAESGKWEEAVNYEKLAVKVATAAQDKELAGEYSARIALYTQKKPCRMEKRVAN